ncbi:11610_t:CDS:2 [Gigaspora margarita]|uniref:11610_t:CDS:1 n=1 Tax=Gigaspora margarita TaxID=4874 RepID=A0ABM8VZJ9_GIGMA|nr:11610_t:CDS:2 [Gigaspora margarita]
MQFTTKYINGGELVRVWHLDSSGRRLTGRIILIASNESWFNGTILLKCP